MYFKKLNWKRGLFRLWLVPSVALWLVCVFVALGAAEAYFTAGQEMNSAQAADAAALGLPPPPEGFVIVTEDGGIHPYYQFRRDTQRRSLDDLLVALLLALSPFALLVSALVAWFSTRWVITGFSPPPPK